VHHCHRIVEALSIHHKLLLGDVYSAKFVSHLSSHYNRLYRSCKDLVLADVIIIERRHVTDDDFALWRRHAEEVLEHTLKRKSHHTRGRLDSFDNAFHSSHTEKKDLGGLKI
jgi:hypothetical protein